MLPVVCILRAGLYAVGGGCGKFGMWIGARPSAGMPRGPCGREAIELVLVRVSKDSWLVPSLGVYITGELCTEEGFAARTCDACAVSILRPANLARSGSSWLGVLLGLVFVAVNAFPCNFSGFGLGVGRIFGTGSAPWPFADADSVRT